jgi:hypothetical protein
MPNRQIQTGDTWESVANQYGVTVAQLRASNPGILVPKPGVVVQVPSYQTSTGNFSDRVFSQPARTPPPLNPNYKFNGNSGGTFGDVSAWANGIITPIQNFASSIVNPIQRAGSGINDYFAAVNYANSNPSLTIPQAQNQLRGQNAWGANLTAQGEAWKKQQTSRGSGWSGMPAPTTPVPVTPYVSAADASRQMLNMPDYLDTYNPTQSQNKYGVRGKNAVIRGPNGKPIHNWRAQYGLAPRNKGNAPANTVQGTTGQFTWKFGG